MKYFFVILFFLSCTPIISTTVIPATFYLDGSKSYDPDGYIAKYEWRQISGSAAQIANSDSSVTTAKIPKKGSYSFELKVTDNQGATDKDTVLVNY